MVVANQEAFDALLIASNGLGARRARCGEPRAVAPVRFKVVLFADCNTVGICVFLGHLNVIIVLAVLEHGLTGGCHVNGQCECGTSRECSEQTAADTYCFINCLYSVMERDWLTTVV